MLITIIGYILLILNIFDVARNGVANIKFFWENKRLKEI